MCKANLFLFGAGHCYLLMAQLLSVLSLCLGFASNICNKVWKFIFFGVNANMFLMSVSHARLLRLGDLETMSLEENTLNDGIQAMTLTAGAELPSSEEPTMSGTVNMVNDATNGTAMASESKNTQ